MEHLIGFILSAQRQLQGVLAGHALQLFESGGYFVTGMAVAVALGLVHALTPGHGKAVIFSYFLGHNAHPFSGIKVAAEAAVTHGSIVVILVLIAGRVRKAFDAVPKR